jgi:uncharacterized protein Veg
MNGTMENIKAAIKQIQGERVRFKANRGRKKCLISEGILENSYASIFTIAVDEGDFVQRHSYTYCDVFTKNVELKVI